MRITLGIERRASVGGSGASPVYDFSGWSLVVDQPDRLVYRPGLEWFLLRLLLAGVMIATALLFLRGYNREVRAAEQAVLRMQTAAPSAQEVFDRALAAGLDAAEAARIQSDHEARLSAPRPTPFWLNAGAQRAVQWGSAAFIAAMALIPLSGAWTRVELSADPRRELAVKRRRFVPKTVRIPWSDVGGIQYGAEETIHRTTQGRVTGHYWKWLVRLKAQSPEANWLATFSPHKQPDRPGPQSRAPQQVVHFIKWCLAHAPTKVSGPYFVEKSWKRGSLRLQPRAAVLTPREQGGGRDDGLGGGVKAPFVQRKATERFVYEDESGVRQTFDSREAIPPGIRDRVDEALSRSPQGGVSQRIVIRDADGRERRYESLEDVPEEIRRRIEEARRRGKGQA